MEYSKQLFKLSDYEQKVNIDENKYTLFKNIHTNQITFAFECEMFIKKFKECLSKYHVVLTGGSWISHIINDFDLFIYNRWNDKDVDELVKDLVSTIGGEQLISVSRWIGGITIKFYNGSLIHKIQIILRNGMTPEAIVDGFDIENAKIGYNFHTAEYFATKLALQYNANNLCIVHTDDLGNGKIGTRLIKYLIEKYVKLYIDKSLVSFIGKLHNEDNVQYTVIDFPDFEFILKCIPEGDGYSVVDFSKFSPKVENVSQFKKNMGRKIIEKNNTVYSILEYLELRRLKLFDFILSD